MTRLSARDCTSGYRCWRREALASVPLDQIGSEGYSFLVEMLFAASAAGLTFAEVPITFVERRQGESKLSNARAPRVGDHAVAADRLAEVGAADGPLSPFRAMV